MRSRGQVALPREVREALHITEGDDVAFVVEAGRVTLRAMKPIPAKQTWFWTDAWQAGEREGSQQLAAGEGSIFADDAFLKSFE